jgi:superfamily II DNA/RNA helicase
VLVFTEYRDTLLHVRDRVAPEAAILHGAMSSAERRQALDTFSRAGVLLATDAAGEGLNLHRGCRVVVNFELPWNPMRLEQRIGRVDRLGQKRGVHVFHFVAKDTEDALVLGRLHARVARADAEVGVSNPLRNGSRPRTQWARGGAMSDEDAQKEYHRQLRARRLAWAGRAARNDAIDWSRGPWLHRTRRAITRSRLRGQTLIIFQACLTDGAGRTHASRLTAILARTSGLHLVQLDVLERLAEAIVDPTLAVWEAAVRKQHQAYWTTRTTREQSLVAALTGPAIADPLQPGLFDLRAMRDREAADADRERHLKDADERLGAMAGASKLTLQSLRPILVLVP